MVEEAANRDRERALTLVSDPRNGAAWGGAGRGREGPADRSRSDGDLDTMTSGRQGGAGVVTGPALNAGQSVRHRHGYWGKRRASGGEGVHLRQLADNCGGTPLIRVQRPMS